MCFRLPPSLLGGAAGGWGCRGVPGLVMAELCPRTLVCRSLRIAPHLSFPRCAERCQPRPWARTFFFHEEMSQLANWKP